MTDSIFFRSSTRDQATRDIATRHIDARRNLCQAFGGKPVLSDPIWDVVLELFARGPVASVDELHARLNGSVPLSNCLRIVQYCVSEGHLLAAGDIIDVSDRTSSAVGRYMREICG